MPIHDWTRVDAGLFHDFHQGWTVALSRALNRHILPPDYFALLGERIQKPILDLPTLEIPARSNKPRPDSPGLTVADHPPKARLIRHVEAEIYARRANRVTIRHCDGDVVAVVEIVSPGNKASRAEFRDFVQRSAEIIQHGIHLLIIDLFPPGPRDPQGIHKAIWDEFTEEEIELPPDKPLTLASYDAGPVHTAYVDFVGVGDTLPGKSLFLQPGIYVPAPLESTYQATWDLFPAPLKPLLESPAPPSRS